MFRENSLMRNLFDCRSVYGLQRAEHKSKVFPTKAFEVLYYENSFKKTFPYFS